MASYITAMSYFLDGARALASTFKDYGDRLDPNDTIGHELKSLLDPLFLRLYEGREPDPEIVEVARELVERYDRRHKKAGA